MRLGNFRSPNAILAIACVFWIALAFSAAVRAQGQSAAAATSRITIVLPPRLISGQPATLAVFGADGKLAPNVDVDLNGVQQVRTNSTGRISFLAPSSGTVLIARAEGASAAALLDSAMPANSPAALTIAPIISLRDSFPICAAGLRGDANENRVKINVEVSLVLAASPECLVILAPPNMPPGVSQISVETPEKHFTASTTLVALGFGPPKPPLLPGQSGAMAVWVNGSDQKLRLVVTNDSPGVLRFARGNSLQLLTSGGARNFAEMNVTALSSGDFSFHARLLPAPDTAMAKQFLDAAALRTQVSERNEITKLAKRLEHHPRDADRVRAQLATILSRAPDGDLRILLDAASSALE